MDDYRRMHDYFRDGDDTPHSVAEVFFNNNRPKGCIPYPGPRPIPYRP
jgi:hypothetical protein